MRAVLDQHKIKIIEEILELIRKHDKFTITTHVNPDGDAIGSTLAMKHFLNSLGKESKIIVYSPVPYNFKFLAGFEEIEIYESRHDAYIMSSEVSFVIDLNDPSRAKDPGEKILSSGAKKIVIDHHINPNEFADLYLIDTEATSAGELMYYLISHDKDRRIPADTASCLYSAIMTDTGSFRFPRTDGNVHRIIGDLIDCGADPVEIYENVYNIKPLRVVKLLGQAFKSIETFNEGKVCIMTLNRGDFIELGAASEDVEDIVEQSLTIDSVRIGILLSQHTEWEEIRVSFRSKGDISVRDLAAAFNGGGHKNAAGARFFDISMDEAKGLIINKIKSDF